jgi:hypothetical protein
MGKAWQPSLKDFLRQCNINIVPKGVLLWRAPGIVITECPGRGPGHSVITIPAGRAVIIQSASASIETEYSRERYNQIIR